jgi:hypothetical protein
MTRAGSEISKIWFWSITGSTECSLSVVVSSESRHSKDSLISPPHVVLQAAAWGGVAEIKAH